MKNTIIFIFLLFSVNVFCSSKIQWKFTSDTQGWTYSQGLTGSVSGGQFKLDVTGANPYLLSPDNLDMNAVTYGLIRISMQNQRTVVALKLSWTTTTDSKWDENKSLQFKAGSNDTKMNDYEVSMLGISAWTGTIKQLRIIFLNPAAKGTVKIDHINIQPMPEEFGIRNEKIHLMQDLTRGGAICYISKASDHRNIVNVSDEGRYIQQSYYAGKSLNRQSEGQSPRWSPWSWNPIQVGDYARNRAKILSSKKTGNTLYVKCIPMLWDMDNKPAQAIMEQWTTLDGNVIKVKNKLTCMRTDNLYGEGIERPQEIPAVYPISALKNLYSYFGTEPFTNAPLDNPEVVYLSSGFWGRYESVPEKWMAFVDDNKWGLGVYSPSATSFIAGMSGKTGGEAFSPSTSYIAPLRQERLMKDSVMEYDYYLIIGTVDEIREKVNELHNMLNKK